MTLPAFIFSAILATLYGAGFHFWRGGGLGRLLLYLVLAWIGFWAGQGVAAWLGWELGKLGPLHLLAATAGSLLCLSLGHWLSLIDER